ncbi:hypothetical protein HanIR_Chr05g0250251 [Helianthus annuus]|nr:hypothetical protein HanIR_Chr05g0250251 [Helianthus annuus]
MDYGDVQETFPACFRRPPSSSPTNLRLHLHISGNLQPLSSNPHSPSSTGGSSVVAAAVVLNQMNMRMKKKNEG